MTISGITTAGDFVVASKTCGSSLAPSTNCQISVAFTPTIAGRETGMLSMSDNSVGSPQQVTLIGSGTLVGVAPASLTCASQPANTSSPAQTVTVTNTGAGPLTVGGITISPGTGSTNIYFSQTNTCIPAGSSSGMVAPGASCTISVTFTPHTAGSVKSTMSINDDDAGSPQTVSLSGMGS